MSLKNVKTRGLVLSVKPYKERDLLVRMLTREAGVKSFFVRNRKTNPLTAVLQTYSLLDLVAKINDDGFSFLDDVSVVSAMSRIVDDLDLQAHASYVMSLAQELLSDGLTDAAVFDFTCQVLLKMDAGLDAEGLTELFELQILPRFGLTLDLTHCQICGRSDLPLDFSFALDGCLCQNHFDKDPKRAGIDANVLYLIGRLSLSSLDALENIKLSDEKKRQMRQFLDELYDHYVGVKPAAKRFLDQMQNWD